MAVFTVERKGANIVVDFPEIGMQKAGFHAEALVDELWKLRKKVRETSKIGAWEKIGIFRELEKIEAQFEEELLFLQRDGEAAKQGLFVLCGACLLSAAVIGWVLWGVF